jgi:glucosamine-6-phosphate deaminase
VSGDYGTVTMTAMHVKTYVDREAMSRAAARHAARAIRSAVEARGSARIVAATGASQFEFLSELTAAPDLPWAEVEMFHLDEYVGLPLDHPASFRKYLLDRLIVPAGIRRSHLLDGERDAARTAEEVGQSLAGRQVDVAFVGIGENAHLAFNDPPADFQTETPYVIVTLDEACRRQQVGEGWFASVADVPSQAISMSIRQILASREIIAVVPDPRKADAVVASLEGRVTPQVPASILQTHAYATVYLDRASAVRLRPSTRGPILESDVE